MGYPESSTLICHQEHGVLTLTMNRAEALNALTSEMLTALIDALITAESDDEVRVVVLTGSGRGFSAGQDLGELNNKEGQFSVETQLRQYYSPLIQRLADFAKPTIAKINGVAAGAGAALAMAADFKLMDRRARFHLAFSQMGLVLDSGASYFLVHALGRTRALELAFFGGSLSAQDALVLGLVNQIAEPGELDGLTDEWAERLVLGPQLAFRLIKQALRQAEGASLAEILELETAFQIEAQASLDHQRAIDAFMNKQPNPFGRHADPAK